MGIEVVWDDQSEDVVHYKFTGKWTWHEFIAAFEQREVVMANSINGRPYAVIGDLLKSQPMPPGAGIQHVYGIFKKYPLNWTVTTIVTPGSFIRTLLTVGIRIHPDARDGFVVVSTLEEARDMIRERRAQLEPIAQ